MRQLCEVVGNGRPPARTAIRCSRPRLATVHGPLGRGSQPSATLVPATLLRARPVQLAIVQLHGVGPL
eukprot:1489152-Pyramimonas_sp.AAC.1